MPKDAKLSRAAEAEAFLAAHPDITHISIIVVEQNARLGLKFADWGCVLDLGRMVFEGPSGTVLSDRRIEELYLGRLRKEVAA